MRYTAHIHVLALQAVLDTYEAVLSTLLNLSTIRSNQVSSPCFASLQGPVHTWHIKLLMDLLTILDIQSTLDMVR